LRVDRELEKLALDESLAGRVEVFAGEVFDGVSTSRCTLAFELRDVLQRDAGGGAASPFAGGVLLVDLVFERTYPFKPPRVEVLHSERLTTIVNAGVLAKLREHWSPPKFLADMVIKPIAQLLSGDGVLKLPGANGREREGDHGASLASLAEVQADARSFVTAEEAFVFATGVDAQADEARAAAQREAAHASAMAAEAEVAAALAAEAAEAAAAGAPSAAFYVNVRMLLGKVITVRTCTPLPPSLTSSSRYRGLRASLQANSA
jgi:hypothetical protein